VAVEKVKNAANILRVARHHHNALAQEQSVKRVLKEFLGNLKRKNEMKNYLTEWKKFKNNILNEGTKTDAAKREVDLATKLGQEKLKNAQAEDKAQEEKQKAEAAAAAAAKATAQKASAGSGTSSTVGTKPTIPEELEGRPADRQGQQPVSLLDEEELTEEEIEEACGKHYAMEEGGGMCEIELEYSELEEEKPCGSCKQCMSEGLLTEAKYKGRTVSLGKPMRGDVKKFKVFVRDPKTGNVKKVNFGDKKMRIKKSNPKRRKSFRARHHCENPGPRTKARYWSCRKW
jgi:hypothetical protein